MSRTSTKARRSTRRRHRSERILRLNRPPPFLQDVVGLHYDLAGRPCGLGTWALLMEGRERYIAREELPNGYAVSTVWLGLDHNFARMSGDPRDPRPWIFETMVFHERTPGGLECRRYATRREALEGHRELVASWRLRPRLQVVPDPPTDP